MREGELIKEPLSPEEATKKFQDTIYFHKGRPKDLKAFFENSELPAEFFEDSKVLDMVADQAGSIEHQTIPSLQEKDDEEHRKMLDDYEEWLEILHEKFPKAGSQTPDLSDSAKEDDELRPDDRIL